MKERPIIFNRDMVLAILDERKAQTRRVMKPQPTRHLDLEAMGNDMRRKKEYFWNYQPNKTYSVNMEHMNPALVRSLSPYGGPADSLWVKETWSPWADEMTKHALQVTEPCLYRADYIEGCPSLEVGGDYRWKTSRYMPRKFSRIILEITEVSVERVQDISAHDCLEEGIHKELCRDDQHDNVFTDAKAALDEFQKLWDSINIKRGFGWEVNPWVWVIGFKQVKKMLDFKVIKKLGEVRIHPDVRL